MVVAPLIGTIDLQQGYGRITMFPMSKNICTAICIIASLAVAGTAAQAGKLSEGIARLENVAKVAVKGAARQVDSAEKTAKCMALTAATFSCRPDNMKKPFFDTVLR
jgi:hypothetical protein